MKTQVLVRPIRDYRVYCEPHTYEAAWALDSTVAATGRTRDEAIARCVELICSHVVPEVVEVEVPTVATPSSHSEMFCEHANENPATCTCPPECPCRAGMCRGKQ